MSFIEKILDLFCKSRVKTEYAYKSIESYATSWGYLERVAGVPLKRERKEDNYKSLPCEQMDKNVCTYSFWSKPDNLEQVFKITYDKKKKAVYISVEFKGLEFGYVQDTKTRLQSEYSQFSFTFGRENTKIEYSETSKMECMDDVIDIFRHFTKIWEECGLYDEMLDYYNMFK